MAFKAAGNPISVFREQLLVNGASFTGTPYQDLFVEMARIAGMPARQTHVADTTDYASNPVEDSWEQRLAGGCGAGANATRLGTSANIRGGQQT